MARIRRSTWWVAGVLAVVGAFLLGSSAFGSSAMPADKAYASGRTAVIVAPNSNATLLTAVLKTSGPEDLIFYVSLQCSIVTEVTSTGSTMPAFVEAEGNVDVWVTVDGATVPIQSVSSNPQPSNSSVAGTDADHVTFCHRDQRQSLVDADNNTMLTEYTATRDANAFNWVYLNAGAGTHTVTVHATLTRNPMTGCSNPPVAGVTCADAIVGNRVLIVEPTKLANNAVIS
jgi:hypothetical protein